MSAQTGCLHRRRNLGVDVPAKPDRAACCGSATSRQPCPTGFTLIELLVVLAVMALLISIIVPALGRARETGRRAVCASNLRETGKAFFDYAELNDGWFPAKPMWATPNAPVWQLATVQHMGSRNPLSEDGWGLQFAGMIRDIVEKEHTHRGADAPKYLTSPKILVCPSDMTGNVFNPPQPPPPPTPPPEAPQVPIKGVETFAAINASASAGQTEKNYSYMYVALYRTDDRPDFFMMADESNQGDIATDSLNSLTEEDNHGRRGINALFIDTHVEWVGVRGGDFNSVQQMAWKLWGPVVLAPARWPESPGSSRSSEVQTID